MAVAPSLSDVHRSVRVPAGASFWRKLLAFSGPGYLVAVGYMDPGNWATDLAGGSAFGYGLLWVVVVASLSAMVLQHLAVKLGLVTGRDLAQVCRESFPPYVNAGLWLMAEIMIVACDLAEVIGTAIALQLLFGVPLAVGVVVTALDVLLLLALQKRGVRWLESLVVLLIATVTGCFVFELVLAQPALGPLLHGLVPRRQVWTDDQMLLIAAGILGATVMPHNLYLHSAVVQTRAHGTSPAAKREAVRFATIDSTVALSLALFVNAAILVLAAAGFAARGHGSVTEIGQAYHLLATLLGAGAASMLFAVALLASGQNSTVTATLAGQVILEGFMNLQLKPWLRRLVTRSLAIVPAVVVAVLYGSSGLSRLLVASQVVLSLQLPFAVVPLVVVTSRRTTMGEFANRGWLKYSAFTVTAAITVLNVWLVLKLVGRV